MKLFEDIQFGADPELFLQNPNSGAFVSAHKWVKGSKYEPYQVHKGAVQLDGVAAEFNIEPVRTVYGWVDNIARVQNELRKMVQDSGYVLVPEPVADFDPVYFDTEVPPECRTLGCSVDYNAWSLEPNPPPDGTRPFRTGAGHIHVGWGHGFDCFDADHYQLCAEVSRQLDYYLGIYSLLWDKDNRRRSLYGKAGAFRPKPYGVEYRVLSNAWLRSEMLQRWVFTAAHRAMDDLNEGIRQQDFHGELAQYLIDNNATDWPSLPDAPEIDGLAFPPGCGKAA